MIRTPLTQIFAASFAFLACALTPLLSSASAGQLTSRPTFNVGAGFQWINDSRRVLVKAEFAGNVVAGTVDDKDGKTLHKIEQYWVVKAKTALNVDAGSGGQVFSFADFEITPYAVVKQDEMGFSDHHFGPAERQFSRLKYAPITITRELELGKEVAVTISAMGVELERNTNPDKDHSLGAYVLASMNTLAIHYLNLSGAENTKFAGFELGTIRAEAGAEYQVGQTALIRLGIGGSANGAIGGLWSDATSNDPVHRMGSMGLTSEQELYLRLSAIIPRRLSDYQDAEVYVQAGFKNLALISADGNGKGLAKDRVPFFIGIGAQAGF